MSETLRPVFEVRRQKSRHFTSSNIVEVYHDLTLLLSPREKSQVLGVYSRKGCKSVSILGHSFRAHYERPSDSTTTDPSRGLYDPGSGLEHRSLILM